MRALRRRDWTVAPSRDDHTSPPSLACFHHLSSCQLRVDRGESKKDASLRKTCVFLRRARAENVPRKRRIIELADYSGQYACSIGVMLLTTFRLGIRMK